jgi:MinD superfamily P-loop ATPase
MKIAVLSGKGGTGKTTVSVNLALQNPECILIDADVEEPNSHIFLKPRVEEVAPVMVEYPQVDMEKCTLCGKCGDFCNFNAIIPAKNQVVVFEGSCHSCGGCAIVCPKDAITYSKREIGKIYSGKSEYKNLQMKYGELNVGELSGVAIINEEKKLVENNEYVVIDSPPGTSCATANTIEDVDFALLVSEPTPFGVSDMKMVVEMLRDMEVPFAVVVNKAGLGDNEIYEYCENEDIKILEEIPYNEEIAKLYADGEIFSLHMKEYEERFSKLFQEIKGMADKSEGRL